MILNVMAVPGNAQFNPLGAPLADYGIPLMTISQDEGFALRDVLGAGRAVSINLQLDIDIRENIQTANVLARLPGASDEEVVIAVHTDGFFQASMDNASGMASALEIARHYAAMPQDERPRTLLFVLFPDHHHGEIGLRAWERTYDWDNVAMALTLEHPSQTQLYWYNDDLMTSNTIGAFRWNAMGSATFRDLVKGTLRDFGVSVYTVMDGRPKLTGAWYLCQPKSVPEGWLTRKSLSHSCFWNQVSALARREVCLSATLCRDLALPLQVQFN